MSDNVLPFVRAEGADQKILVENTRLRELLRQAGIPFDAAEAHVDTGFMAGGGEMGTLMRSMDWSQTSFGPVSGWSQSLRSAVSICLTTRFPVVLYYGPERALIYNDAWRPVVGDKHPWSFGRAGTEVWAEIWDIIGPMFDTVFETGEATWSDDQLLPLNRFGYVEECYFYYSYSPIRGEQGRVEGIFTAVAETTLRVVADRRTRLLRDRPPGLSRRKRPRRPTPSPPRCSQATRTTCPSRCSTPSMPTARA